MGSFANSIHVKSEDSAAVAEAIRALLLAEGYEATDEKPERRSLSSPLRAFHVAQAQKGWVAVLDSDIMGVSSLAATLSDQLQTHALQFMVNDSDSWHYQLYRAGEQLDEFNSCGDEDDEESAGLGGAMAGVNVADFQRIAEERAAQLQKALQERLPPEMRELQHKWKTTGKVSPEEMQQYNQWMRSQMPTLLDQLKSLMSGMPGGAGSAAGPSRDTDDSPARDDLQAHVDHLQPLLQNGVKEKHVLHVLGKQATFAEETLGEFLPLVGISAFYANLSYSYAEEFAEQDLNRESIQLAEHLKFKKTTVSGMGHLRISR